MGSDLFEDSCATTVEAVYLAYGLQGEAPVQPRFRLEPHVAKALRAVLGNYQRHSHESPLLLSEPPELRRIDQLWWSIMRTYRGHEHFGMPPEPPVKLGSWGGSERNTFRFEQDGVTYRFRRAGNKQADRVQYNADRLAILMQMENSLVSRLAIVNGMQGVVSEWKEGRLLHGISDSEMKELVAKGEIDAQSYAEASDFEWLINHSCCGSSQLLVTPEKKLVVFKRNECLTCGTNPPPEGDEFHLGWTLPERHSRRFIDKLKAFNREVISFAIQLDLGTAELNALLFRRE